MSESPISYQDLSDTLVRLRAGVSASDLHGSLTGYLCAGGKASADTWLDALALDFADTSAAGDSFAILFRQCRKQLDDAELGFEPMMPADDADLSPRAEALVDWCRGFLGGVGLAGNMSDGVSETAREIVKDFGAIAASNFDYTGSEEDETALAEVIEFVRVGVLLFHAELAPGLPRTATNPPPSRRLH